jgi:P-type conjugative transfer protein TrbJ
MKYVPVFLAATAIFYSLAANAQIATIDQADIVQTTISAEEAITQTAQQLQQLENQIQNTNNPSSFQWDKTDATINNVLATVNTLSAYQNQAGSLAEYLNNYSNASQYKAISCIGTGGCTGAQIQQINASQYMGLDSQKTANDNMLLNLDAQLQQLHNDAANLNTLQQNAQGSTGQMQALQAANQLASNQAAQLMQIRSLMIAEHTAEVTRAETVVDHEAKQQAASDAFIGTPPAPSEHYSVLNYTGAAQ